MGGLTNTPKKENNEKEKIDIKEIVINRKINEQDLLKFNEMAPITITLSNTKNQDPNILAKFNKNITIRVLGGFNEMNFPEYANDKYYKQTKYSPSEVARLIEFFNSIESNVNPAWSDLEKATYGYIALMSKISPKNEVKKEKIDDNRPLKQILDGQADSLGFSFIYKELMDRLGIACRYEQSSNGHSWNEVLINNEYYPADLFEDAMANFKTIANGEFELKNFLSDKEFYYKKEHQTGKKEIKKVYALEHSEIQKTIDNIYNPEYKKVKEIPKISLKSKELQKALETEEIDNDKSFGIREEIRIDLTNSAITELKEDLVEIGKYYPNVLDNITLANNTGTHIDMQEIIDTVYEGRKNEDGKNINPTNLVIESNIPEDFDLDFSNAPEVVINDSEKIDEISYNQKISFKNTSSSQIKLPNLKGKIPNTIDTIRIENCDVEGFDITLNKNIGPGTGVLRNARKLELVGGNTSGIRDIIGLDDVISLSVDRLSDEDFKDVMDISILNDQTMPRLFDIYIYGQNLAGRDFLSEIKNPNIVQLEVRNSSLENVVGLDSLKNQLISLSLNANNLSIEDLKKVSEIKKDNPIIRMSYYSNSELNDQISRLTGNVITDETYNYLNSYFRRSGFIDYRGLTYSIYTHKNTSKKEMLKDFSRIDLDKVPYYIEDAKVFREILPYTNNPMMIKDLTTFENYLNDSSNYFEQDYLKKGTLLLTKEQLNYLISSGKTIPQDINLKINTVSDLTKQELENFKRECDSRGLNLAGVKIFDDRCMDRNNPEVHNFDQKETPTDPYEIDEYYKIREELDEIIKDIHSGMTDAEKFAVVYKRLADKIVYDHQVAEDSFSKEHAIYKAKLFCKSRNLSEGLIEKEGFDIETNSPNPTLAYRTVCAGYSDILKNALDLVGIESVIDSGNVHHNLTQNTYSGGHAWNKVNIDGKWYYADLTWDAGKDDYKYSLKGTDDFIHSNNMMVDSNGNRIERNGHFTRVRSGERNEQVQKDNFDQAVLKDLFYKVKNNELPSKYRINIPDDPDFTFNPSVDIENIKQEYLDRKNDMLAKFYGDKEYKRRYDEISARYRENEIEVTNAGITYRTVQDYAERENDEKFLILGEYKNSLERMSKYDAGDTSVYSGTADQIKIQYEKDKEYVETRNHTFDQNKNTQKDLATLGKYGETLPYIPKQQGIWKNSLRIIGNAGILARNIVAPVYRFAGKYVAQPIHRAITRGNDASPYRNNPYHRFVARRNYFKDVAKQNDMASGKNHPMRNYMMSNVRAITKYKDGNKAVLNAGAYDIQDNLKKQEIQNIGRSFYESKRTELENQIATLENEINNHKDAQNIIDAQKRLQTKKAILKQVEANIITLNTTGKITDIQTDAISSEEHDIASKEINTYRVAVIKGVAKLGIKKFVGPKIKNWLMEHTEKQVQSEEVYKTTIMVEKEVQDPSKTISITEQVPDYDIEVDELIEKSKDKTVNMYRSVSGGNRGEFGYTIRGDEVCSGFHFQDGTKWGTGYSGNAPLITDKVWPESFLDASNKLREDLTFSEIAKAISEGELSEEVLENMTLQIGNQGWVYANELFDGITKEVQVGTKVIEGAKRIEMIPQIVDRTRTVTKMVQNKRVVEALNTLGIASNVIGNMDTVHNAGEILRPTKSDLNSNKNKPREYGYDDSEFFR